MALVAASIVSQALVLTGRTAPLVVPRWSAATMMERMPGEGDPFSELCPPVDEYGNNPNSVRRTDVGIDRWHSDSGYIEEDDEPWHSTCVVKTVELTKAMADESFNSVLPFIAPEEALVVALSKVTTIEDVDKAIADGLKAGCRPGCPAIMDAEKIKKSAKEGTVKAGKAPKVAAQGNGWDNMKRAEAKVHDNSV